MGSTWRDLVGEDPVVLDGGLSTQLEAMGRDIGGPLWTGRALLADPGAVALAHAAFVEAGARIVISASYQVSRRGFTAAGLPVDQADAALRASTAAARAGAGEWALVAASVGPYGAILHDGSEYRGRYGLGRGELVAFHRERLDVLADTNPDLLAVETIPDVDEAVALATVLADHPDLPAWMSFSAVDEARTCAGQPIEEAVAVASAVPSVVAVGVNCTDPRFVAELIARVRATSDLPVVVYPNAGGTWSADDGTWHGAEVGGAFPDDLVLSWREAGATAIGGCCGTDARAVSALARVLARPAG